ncbi:glycoside hydrolase, partial [Streptomyces sp. NPDC006251]
MASGAEVVGVTAGVLTAGGGALSVASPDGVRLAVADGLADVVMIHAPKPGTYVREESIYYDG